MVLRMLPLDYLTTLTRLEIEPRRQLNLSRPAEAEQSTELVADRRNAATEESGRAEGIRIASQEPSRRIGEIRFVEDVEYFNPKLKRGILSNSRILEN